MILGRQPSGAYPSPLECAVGWLVLRFFFHGMKVMKMVWYSSNGILMFFQVGDAWPTKSGRECHGKHIICMRLIIPIAHVGNKLLGLNFPTNPCKRKSLNLRNHRWVLDHYHFVGNHYILGGIRENSHKSFWLHLSFEIFWQCLTMFDIYIYAYIYMYTHTAIHNIYTHVCSPIFKYSMLCWVALHTSIIDARAFAAS